MMIFLGIIVELATVAGTLAIVVRDEMDAIIKIPENGYKIDKDTFEKWRKQRTETVKEVTLIQKWKFFFLLLFPGVNLINATIKGVQLKRSVMNNPQFQEVLIPMTQEEKDFYSRLEGRFQKVMCATFSITKKEEEELMGFDGKHPIIVDHGLMSIYNEKLLPLAYTLDEVKRLNEATTYSYRIGKVDGRNVAIIGIPNSNKAVCRLEFVKEDGGVKHTYESISEEEAQNSTFIVYPFSSDDEEEVQKVIEEIRASRIQNAKKVTVVSSQNNQTTSTYLDALQLPNENLVDIQAKENCGPVLKKSLF